MQVSIYSDCVEELVNGSLRGYNATVLAYGQTGSGKTFTIGTGFDRELIESQEGIIPRAIRHLFSGIQAYTDHPYDENGSYLGSVQFSIAAQFMELYNEEIIDLLDPYGKGKIFKIHEDSYGSISVAGATIRPLKTPQEALACLQQGAIARTTASTNMNEMRFVKYFANNFVFKLFIYIAHGLMPSSQFLFAGNVYCHQIVALRTILKL